MSVKVTRPCAMYRPSFFHEVDDVALTIRYFDSNTGFEAVFDAAAHKLLRVTRQTRRIEIAPALELERRFARAGAPNPVLMSGDKHDTTKASGTTGGGRRYFISPAFELALRGVQAGYDALHDWAVDQGQRPTAWVPFNQWRYDGYFGTLQPSGWKCDKQDAQGWSIYRADHLEGAVLFGGAALGEDMALAAFCELLKWVSRTIWNEGGQKLQQGWHGSRQPRAMGWVPWFLARASFLGFDTGDAEFISENLGAGPKAILKQVIADLNRKPPRIGEQTKPDDRTMVDFKDGSGEIVGEYPWQWAIYFAAMGWIQRSGLLQNSTPFANLMNHTRLLADDVWARSIGPGGVTYAYSASTTFTQADCDKANAMETDKSHVYELVDGVIRDQPRKADAEMTAGAIAMLHDAHDPRCEALLALLAPPSNMQNYDDLQRYADVAYAPETETFVVT